MRKNFRPDRELFVTQESSHSDYLVGWSTRLETRTTNRPRKTHYVPRIGARAKGLRTYVFVTSRMHSWHENVAGLSRNRQCHTNNRNTHWCTDPYSGNMSDMSGFSRWVERQLELRPDQDISDAARALQIRPSELKRWLGSKRPPTQETMRLASRVLNAPIREILIAAEYLTIEEASPDGLPTSELSTQELLAELSRREDATVKILSRTADNASNGW